MGRGPAQPLAGRVRRGRPVRLDDAEYAAAIARADEPDSGEAKAYAATHRVLCAHADDGQDAHWLAPGEQCTRGQAGLDNLGQVLGQMGRPWEADAAASGEPEAGQ